MSINKKISLILLFLLLVNLLLLSNYSQAKEKEVTLTKIGEFRIGGVLFDVEVEDSIAYVSEYSASRLRIIDVSDPTSPFELGNYSVNLPHYISVVDEVAYIAAWNHGLQIVNVSDPSNPSKLSEFIPPGFVGGIHVVNNYAFVGATNADMHLLDVSDPSNPQNISSFSPGGTISFFKKDDLVFILAWSTSTETSNVVVADYSDPENPSEVSRFDLGDISADISVVGDYVYTSCLYGGLKILNYSDIENPELLSVYDEGGEAYALEVINDIVYLGNGYRGLELYDVSNKSSPSIIANYSTSGFAEELKVQDDLIYLNENGRGLVIIQVEGLPTSYVRGFEFSLTLMVIPIIIYLKRRKIK